MFLQQLVNGLTLGSAYAVIAIGYTLVFGVLNIVNMAHGGIFMVGAYIGLLLVTEAGFGIFPALIGAMVGGAVLTPEYAEKIGADWYAKDAKRSADIAKEFFGV